jgi:ankyrin
MAHDKAPFAAAAMRDDAGATPLFAAASAGRLAHVSALLMSRRVQEVNARDVSGTTPLLAAAKMGHVDVLSELLRRGADANAGGSTGETALHMAASRSGSAHLRMMKSLLAHGGVLVDARTQSGDTPLMFAAARCDFQQIQLLLSHGASRQARNSNLRRAFDLANRAPHRGSIGLICRSMDRIYRLLS